MSFDEDLVYLQTLDPQSEEFLSNLRKRFFSDEFHAFITNLQGDAIKDWMNFLDKALDRINQYDEIHRRSVYILKTLCARAKEPPLSLQIPHELITYNSNLPFAAGGFSDLFKGLYQGREVVLKVFRVFGADHRDQVSEAFFSEVVVWGKLLHPNILPLLGVMMGGPGFCTVSEWMPHSHISHYLKHFEPGKRSRPSLLVDVVEGLQYLHARGIVHGDLKGANILIDSSGCARLADFGLSFIMNENNINTAFGTALHGTTRWMAPELLDIEDIYPRPDKRGDIYALAMVVIEVFTGRVPFFQIRETQVIFRVLKGVRPERPEDGAELGLSDEMWEMVKRCWHHDPSQRPEISEILACFRKAAAAFEETRDISDSEPGPSSHVVHPIEVHRDPDDKAILKGKWNDRESKPGSSSLVRTKASNNLGDQGRSHAQRSQRILRHSSAGTDDNSSFEIISLLHSVLHQLPDDDYRMLLVKHLADAYRQLLDAILSSDMKQHAEVKRSRANYLIAQASVAAFLAVVQIGFIAFTAGVHSNPASTVQRVTDIFSFCAIFFDDLSALSALTTAHSLLKLHAEMDRFMQTKAHIDRRMYGPLYSLQNAVSEEPKKQGDDEKKEIENLTFQVSDTLVQLGRLDHIRKKHAVDNHAALRIVILGVICFFVSLIAFIINSQPPVVWVPTIVAVTVATGIVLKNENDSHTGRWSEVVRRYNELFGFRKASKFTPVERRGAGDIEGG